MLTGTFKNMFASFLGSSSHLWEIFRIKYIRCAFRTLTNVSPCFPRKSLIVNVWNQERRISGCPNKFTEEVMILQILKDIVSWGGALEVFSYEIVVKNMHYAESIGENTIPTCRKTISRFAPLNWLLHTLALASSCLIWYKLTPFLTLFSTFLETAWKELDTRILIREHHHHLFLTKSFD